VLRADPLNRDTLLLIPLREICKTAEDVADLIHQLFKDIKAQGQLSNFEVARRMRRGVAGALVDGVILQPNLSGIGFDLKKLFGRGWR
jgi:hypothetical protein